MKRVIVGSLFGLGVEVVCWSRHSFRLHLLVATPIVRSLIVPLLSLMVNGKRCLSSRSRALY